MTRCCGRWLAIVITLLLGTTGRAHAEPLVAFDRPFDLVHGDFSGHVQADSGDVRIKAPASRGGAGYFVERDLSAYARHTLRAELTVHAANASRSVRVLLIDAESRRRVINFDLRRLEPEQRVVVLADGGVPLAPAGEPFDLASVRQIQFQSQWGASASDVTIHSVALLAPDAAVDALRDRAEQARARQARAALDAETQRRQRMEAAMRNGVTRPADGARVVRMSAAAEDLIGVELLDREVIPAGPMPYVPQEGDELRPGTKLALAWDDGKVVNAPISTKLFRRDRSTGCLIDSGFVFQPFGQAQKYVWTDRLAGTPLERDLLTEPMAYVVRSADDERFAEGVPPVSVSHKARPMDRSVSSLEQSVLHFVYLQVPHALRPGATYTVELRAINTRDASAVLTHDPRSVRSESIHASHIGYRPDDPTKRAFLSLWTGTGGAVAFDADAFELIDVSGRTVYTGRIERVLAAGESERLKTERNHTQTNVYAMDFGAFASPGEYRVHVPGIGVSHSFTIGDEAWAGAFRTSMMGFLHHRSGIELGPPVTDYRRPRNMHPDDGVPIFDLNKTSLDGEIQAVTESFTEMLGSNRDISRLKRNTAAWGGYMDAGDWDRRSPHLMVSLAHLELVELFPSLFETFPLNVPPSERENLIPDLIDEALWNLMLYRRLQREDGAVGGGVESTSHPRDGEASWQETLLLGAFAPDPKTSYLFAAVAARASGLLSKHDPSLAADLGQSARRAFEWAESKGRHPEARLLAAVELLKLTRDQRFNEVVRASESLITAKPGELLDAVFAYARVDDGLADPALKQRCRDQIIRLADTAIEFQRGNAFGLATHAPSLPMMGYTAYYSAPEMVVGPVLPRAHVLTGDTKYLSAMVLAAHYSAGANPLNMTMTTGVGHAWPTGVLHIDSRVTGQPAPAGITVYGPMDPSEDWAFANWAHAHYLNLSMVPNSRTWPSAEFYAGLYLWPAMNEYTVHQTMRPTSYYWGYLAARPPLKGE
jgi:endoglucanase